MDPRDEVTSEAGLDEDQEAFLDVNDPENEILDDGNDDVDVSDDDEKAGGGGAAGEEDEEAEEEEEPQGEMPTEKEPERDDAVAVFAEVADKKPLHTLSVNPKNSSIVASAGESDEIYITKDSKLVATLTGHTDTITLLEFSPDGQTLASGCMDNTVKLWDTDKWELIHNLQDLCGEIECLLWHSSSLMLVGGATDAQAVMWNVKKGTVAQYFVGHRATVTCCNWACDRKRLITASADGSVFVFNPKTAEAEVVFPTKELSKDQAGVTQLVDLSANGDLWAAGCEDGTVHILSISRQKVIHHLDEIHEQSIEAMVASREAGFFITGSCDCKVCIWHIDTFRLRKTIQLTEGITCARFNGFSIVCGCTDGDVRVWDVRGECAEPDTQFMGHRMFISGLALNKEINTVMTVSDDGTMRTFPLAQ